MIVIFVYLPSICITGLVRTSYNLSNKFYGGMISRMKNCMEKLQEKAKELGPLCVGLDTSPAYIPQNILHSVGSDGEAVFLYNQAIINGIKDSGAAPCVKVQIAYYEAMGLEGLKVYSRTLKLLKQEGLVSIADIKRGDIAATAESYALAHLAAASDFEADIVTLNPFMGGDTIEPYEKYFLQGKGSFVLLCTSNPGATDIELQKNAEGNFVSDKVAAIIEKANERFLSAQGGTLGAVGAVVGATQSNLAEHFRNLCKDTFFLIPGFGAQGGDLGTVKTLLSKAGGVVNSSRAILCAWKKDAALEQKRESNTLTLADITQSAIKKALESKKILTEG